MSAENLFQNLLTLFILLSLVIIVYCRITGQTITEAFRGFWDLIRGGGEESAEMVKGGFENIR